ncbi:hypothetical protein KSP40_PGU000572 [Platanthera guangdongensis]|uniref:Uncharacterized protein n=1 Tax=Platanthera guangdongensis TaxID=2320717 RepID=A0ABR2LUC9_9ASPA
MVAIPRFLPNFFGAGRERLPPSSPLPDFGNSRCTVRPSQFDDICNFFLYDILLKFVIAAIPSSAAYSSSRDSRTLHLIAPFHFYRTFEEALHHCSYALPLSAHPMTQFTSGVMALQVQSEFQKAYENGISKAK